MDDKLSNFLKLKLLITDSRIPSFAKWYNSTWQPAELEIWNYIEDIRTNNPLYKFYNFEVYMFHNKKWIEYKNLEFGFDWEGMIEYFEYLKENMLKMNWPRAFEVIPAQA